MLPAFVAKLCPRAELQPRLAELARPLVFTNGVFDILHRGHVTYLAQARALRRQPGARPQQRRLGARPRQGAGPAAEQRRRPAPRARRAREREPGDPVRRADAARAAQARPSRSLREGRRLRHRDPGRDGAGAQLGRRRHARCPSSRAIRPPPWSSASAAEAVAGGFASRWRESRGPSSRTPWLLALAPGRKDDLALDPQAQPRRLGRALLGDVGEQRLVAQVRQQPACRASASRSDTSPAAPHRSR